MNRFLAYPRLAVLLGGWLRCACGLMACTAIAAALSIGAAAPSYATDRAGPEPRGSVPPICRHAAGIGDRHTARKCREAWRSMHERSPRRPEFGRGFPRWADRHTGKPRTGRRTPSPAPLAKPRPSAPLPDPRPAPPDPPGGRPSSPTRAKATSRPASPAPGPIRTQNQAREVESPPRSLRPVVLLSLLVPAAAVICYPFRHRVFAFAGAGLPVLRTPDVEERRPAAFGYRPVLDPFAVPAMGLSGPGAVSTARVLALTALGYHGDDSLVVIPRPDATTLFGLAEDELLDDETPGLFIPGNLDAAVAYLETELVIRRNTGVTQARRLLLVADCAQEIGRIEALLARHPGGASAILLGPWTGEQATIDDNGLVSAPPSLALGFPGCVPAMSRTEARDHLLAVLAQHGKTRESSPRRRSSPRRP